MTKGIWMVGVALLASCTTIQYRGRNTIPVTWTAQSHHRIPFEYEDKVHFYLWGLYPQKHSVWLDQVAAQEGLRSLSKVKIEEYLKWDDWLWGVLTLGMYTPRTYKISGLTGE